MAKTDYHIIDNVIYTPDFDLLPDYKGVGHYYYTQMMKHKNTTAQIDGYTKKEDTFGTLLQRSVRTALAMIDEGIQPGDYISVCTYNHFNSGVPHIASYLTGSIMAAIDPSLSVEEAVYLLNQTLPKIIFVSPIAVSMVEKVVERIGSNTKIVVFGETTQHIPFSNFIRPHKNENEFKPREVENLDEVALVVFSSGSTGLPKGICYSHRNMVCFSNMHHSDVSSVMYSVATPYWNVFVTFLHLSVEFGCTRVLYKPLDGKDFWTMFYQQVDMAFLTPLQALQMVRSEKPEQINLKNVKTLYLGANFVTLEQLKEIASALPHTQISQGYSQSEVFKTILLNIDPRSKLAAKNLCAAGTVCQGFSYKVVDIETGKVVGPNQVGELVVKSQTQFIGYLNKDSSECFDSDGWLKTGDLFYYNEDLCFYFVDRIKESFKFHDHCNHHISPVEIETVILKLKSVEDVCVIGIPHETECNHPMAVVKLKPNEEKISAEEIVKYVEETLEDAKRLRGGVKFVEYIPLTSTGKFNRYKLKKMILNNEMYCAGSKNGRNKNQALKVHTGSSIVHTTC